MDRQNDATKKTSVFQKMRTGAKAVFTKDSMSAEKLNKTTEAELAQFDANYILEAFKNQAIDSTIQNSQIFFIRNPHPALRGLKITPRIVLNRETGVFSAELYEENRLVKTISLDGYSIANNNGVLEINTAFSKSAMASSRNDRMGDDDLEKWIAKQNLESQTENQSSTQPKNNEKEIIEHCPICYMIFGSAMPLQERKQHVNAHLS